MTPSATSVGSQTQIVVQVAGAAGPKLALYAAPDSSSLLPSSASKLGSARLDPTGSGMARFMLPNTHGEELRFFGVYRNQGLIEFTPTVTFHRNGVIRCQQLDFDDFLGQVDNPVAGLEITSQWQAVGLEVSAVNNNAAHPHKAILSDSANPTGADTDLETPGYGAGKIVFGFDGDVTFYDARVLDVDGSELDVFRFFDVNDSLLAEIQMAALGDNSVQTLTTGAPLEHVRKIEANFGGSGAITHLRWCPIE